MTKGNEISKGRISQTAVITWGFFAIFGTLVTLFWTGNSLSLLFFLAATAIFIWSFFKPQAGFFALIFFRTAFDNLGSQLVLFNLGSLEITLTFILGLMPIVLAAYQLYRQPLKPQQQQIFYPWFIFLGLTVVLSLFVSFDRGASLVNLFRLLSFVSIFIYSYLIFNTPQKLTKLIRYLIFTAIIPAAVAWQQLLNRGGFYDGEQWRAVGTFTHPNMLALYLVLIICLTLFLVLNLRKQALERWPYLLLSLFFFVPLIFTYTRIAWLALAGILIVVGIIHFRKLLLVGILVFLLLYIFVPFFGERINTLANVGITDSASWRLDLWRDISGYIKKSPWVGYGPGTASVFLGQHIPRLMMDTEPHNDYLRVWLEGGVILLLSYLAIYASLLRRFYLAFKREKRPRLKMLVFFVTIFTLGVLGASLTDNVIKDAVMQWNFWALTGSLLAVVGLSPKIVKSK